MLKSDVSMIKSVGKQRAKLFNKLGIYTIYDMLCFFPRNYEDRSQVKNIADVIDGENICIKAKPFSVLKNNKIRRGMSIQRITVADFTGSAVISWFNQDWLVKTFNLSTEYIFYGKVTVKNGKLEMTNPIFEPSQNSSKFTSRIVPIYPLTARLTQKAFQVAMENCMPYIDEFTESMPNWVREKYTLCGIDYAVKNIHFPENFEKFEYARKRLAFEELLLLQLGLRLLKQRRVELCGTPLCDDQNVESFIKTLPFPLTNAQKRVTYEIIADLKKVKPMNRLVQGDVGCGKTIVAAISMLVAVHNGTQAAMMVPTEILAEQHYKSLTEVFNNQDIKVALLTGSLSAKQKKEVCENIASGEIDIIIGTHALIQSGVSFKNLAIVVTDEQHRFGVKQRAALAEKGSSPHTLVMTATPIPRTLALILYGDLEVSVIDEMPPGRKLVETFAVDEGMRERINSFLVKQLTEGRQVYIVCPLVEESETLELKSATAFADELQKNVLCGYTVGLIHGRLKPKEKDEIMRRFANCEINALVSTTVIEVGVNVPNASLMIIENAERFGLSQLHQLRGRVGRGQWQSYCVLFCQGGNSITKQRMSIMKETNDGFKISEKDLELRGPGEFFGTRQHGLPELKIANIYTDMELLTKAGEVANAILENDALLENEENSGLRQSIMNMFSQVDIFEFN